MSDNIEITLWNGTQKISVTDDFSTPLQISALSSYWNSNKISIALNSLSAIGGVATGIATGNVAAIAGSVKTGVDIGNEIFRASETPKSIYGRGGAELTFSFAPKGIVLWIFTPQNEDFLLSAYSLFGGDCNNARISFNALKSLDKTPNSYGTENYYEFTKIVSDYPQPNKIAPLLLGGVEMEFIE